MNHTRLENKRSAVRTSPQRANKSDTIRGRQDQRGGSHEGSAEGERLHTLDVQHQTTTDKDKKNDNNTTETKQRSHAVGVLHIDKRLHTLDVQHHTT